METPAVNAAARFRIDIDEEVSPFDGMLDFLQFMSLTPLKKPKVASSEGDAAPLDPAKFSARFYYTKRVADNL